MTPGNASNCSPRLPGEPGVWVLIGGDLLVFSAFFLTFLFYRADAPAAYSQSAASMNLMFGTLNTLLLLTSSWYVANAAEAARQEQSTRAARLLAFAMLCGAGFVVVKFFEYREKILAGHGLVGDDFYMFYFMFTGIHLVHVLIGLAVLGWLRRRTLQRPVATPQDIVILESGASFWHLVDILWIVLFALFYLVG
jgi:nitric oxide reductase NorE protein